MSVDPFGPEGMAQLRAFIDSVADSRKRVNKVAQEAVSRAAGGVRNWSDPEQIAAFSQYATRVVSGGQRNIAGVTELYLSRVASLTTGRPFAPVAIAPEMGATRRILAPGAHWEQVYDRVATTYRVTLAETKNKAWAFRKANRRAIQMVETDLGLAFRDQVDAFIRRERRAWASKYAPGSRHEDERYLFAYRRVVRPELSNGNVCGLCIAASTRIYYRGDLMPLHTGCHCEVLLVTRDSDPGDIINRDELDQLYETAGGTDYASLRRTKYVVQEHGELGPQLWHAEHKFQGPDSLELAH